MKKWLLFFIVIFLNIQLYGQCKHSVAFFIFGYETPKADWETAVYESFEIGIEREKYCETVVNPFNPEEIQYYAEILAPDGSKLPGSYIAFYHQAFEDTLFHGYAVKWKPILTKYPFRIRLALELPGVYQFKIFCKNSGSAPRLVEQHSLSINESPTKKHGFLKFSPISKRYLQYSDGTPFFAIGEKMSYHRDMFYEAKIPGIEAMKHYSPRTISDYQRCIKELATNGGNYISIIMCPWSFEVEGRETAKLGDYTPFMKRLSDLDSLLRICENAGVHVQLSLIDHTILEWLGTNPYRTLLTPSLEKKIDFFTDPNVRKHIQNKIIYLNARYGQLPVVSAFEILSETETLGNDNLNDTMRYGIGKCPNPADGGETAIPCPDFYWSNNHAEIINKWVVEMGEFLRALNHRIPITNGVCEYSTWAVKPNYPQNKRLDTVFNFLSIHAYVALRTRSMIENVFINKFATDSMPVQLGETGWGGVVVGECPQREWIDNEMHNMIWSSSFMGSFGCGLDWFWQDYTHSKAPWVLPNDKGYKHFKPLSLFWQGEDLTKTYWKPICTPAVWDSTDKDNWGFEQVFRTPEKGLGYIREEDLSNLYQEISVNNPIDIESYALKSNTKILGWVHHKDNYIRNLPRSGQFDTPECRDIYQKSPLPSPILPISKEEITLKKLRCNGKYKVSWWNPYHVLSDTNVSTMAEGEIIRSGYEAFQHKIIQSEAGTLKIPVPPLHAYDMTREDPYLPDYAYKVSLTEPFISLNPLDKNSNIRWKSTPVNKPSLETVEVKVARLKKEKKKQYQFILSSDTIHLPTKPHKKTLPSLTPNGKIYGFVSKDRQIFVKNAEKDTTFNVINLATPIRFQKNTPIVFEENMIYGIDTKGYPVIITNTGGKWSVVLLSDPELREETTVFIPSTPKTIVYPESNGFIYQGKNKLYYKVYPFNPCECEK